MKTHFFSRSQPLFGRVLAQGLILALLLSAALEVSAAPFTFQGRLNVSSAPASGSYDLQFSLFDAASDGNQQGSTLSKPATDVTNRLFKVTLDFGNQFTGPDRWLEIAVQTNGGSGFHTLSPRQQLTPVPYAIFAGTAGAVAASDIRGTLDLAQLSAPVLTNGAINVNISGTFGGDGSGLTNLPVVPLPAGLLTNNQSDVVFNDLTVTSNVFVDGTNFANYLVVTNPPWLDGSDITNLDASKITSGTLSPNQLPDSVLQNNSYEASLGGDFSGLFFGTFYGNGSGLHNLKANQLTGTISNSVLPNLDASIITSGTFSLDRLPDSLVQNDGTNVNLSGTFSGDGSGLTNLPLAGLLTNNQSDVVFNDLTVTSNVFIAGTNFANYLVVTNPPWLDGSDITNLNAANLVGTFNASALPQLDGSNITSGTLSVEQLPGSVLQNNATDVTLSGNFNGTFTGGFYGSHFGDGAGLYNLDAGQLTGTLSPAVAGNLNLKNLNANGAIAWTPKGSGAFEYFSAFGDGFNSWGFGTASVVAADVNGDGAMDLIVAEPFDYGGTELRVWINDGHGGFTTTPDFSFLGSSQVYIVATDVNRDGKVDLIYAEQNSDSLTISTNDGTGRFVFASVASGLNSINSVITADVDGDGLMELITASYNGNSLTVLTNDGAGGFVIASLVPTASYPQSVTAADVNRDGHVDLITANDGQTLTVLVNDGTGGFAITSVLSVPGNPQSVTAADVNGDGRVDLIAPTDGNTLTILTNDGSGGFAVSSSPWLGGNRRFVTAADVNGDGHVDLIAPEHWGYMLTVLTNNGSGGFVFCSSAYAGDRPDMVVAADVTGDGQLDLISANEGYESLVILTNTPSANAFTSTFTGNGAGLKNIPASSITGGLTVNVDVLAPGDRTNTLVFVNGILTRIQ